MFHFFSKKRELAKELEVRAIVMEELSKERMKKRQEEEMILDLVKSKKLFYEDHYASDYLSNLQALSEKDLKLFALKGLQEAVRYIRHLGAEILKEDIFLHQRVLGVMLHDLSDSVHNLPLSLDDKDFDRSSLEFELLLLLQFVHAYNDYKYIQKESLCVPFIIFKNSFPPGFLINDEVKSETE